MEEVTLWGTHAGKTGDADSLFLQKNIATFGWREMELAEVRAKMTSYLKELGGCGNFSFQR
jgi:restriction system protein